MSQNPAEDANKSRFIIVVNHEEQYSVWPLGSELPSGWRRVEDEATREGASKETCLSRIGEIWTDLRPASLR